MRKTIMLFTVTALLLLTACAGTTTTTTPATSSGQATKNTGSESKPELKPVTLRLAHVSSATSITQSAVNLFAEKVKEKTDGNVTIEIYPGSQLGGERDIVENIANGSLEMGAPSTGIFANFTSVLTTINMPFLIKNSQVEYQLVTSDLIRKEAFKEIEGKLNIKPLVFLPSGMFQFGTRGKELHNLEDLKGLKMRAMENAMLIDSFEALGMNPTPMAFTEVFNSFETGVIDAGPWHIAATITDGYKDVTKHLSIVNAYTLPFVLAINLEKFNSLPLEYQTAIDEASVEVEKHQYSIIDDYHGDYLQQIKDLGITVAEDFDHTGIDEKIKPVHDKYAAQDPFVKRTIELVHELNSKY